jgi:hypothetical protein
MDERAALAVTAVQAIETTDRERAVWTDADRAWASRAAAEVEGASASPAVYLARRAQLALERIGVRAPALARVVRAAHWRPWVGVVLVVAALVVGVASDQIGSAQRINILAPPVLLLVMWNLAVYVVLAVGYVKRYGDAAAPGPIRRTVARWAGGLVSVRATHEGADPMSRALAAFAGDWTARATPLYAARAARILHLAAAAFALGVIGGLYVRGLGLEYRATWESTFLDAGTVRSLVAFFYAPGALLSGIAVPDAAHIAAIRAPASENAAPWLHLMAATLAVVVIVPRLVLALGMWLVERYRAARIGEGFDAPYFARLQREFGEGTVAVRVVPYSFTVTPGALATLETLLARAVGAGATLAVAPAVAYGDEDTAAAIAHEAGRGPVVALFNATATPERETHGQFLAALAAAATPGRPVLVIVDEAAFNARWRDDQARREARRRLWRDFCAEARLAPVFVDLAEPDLNAAEEAIDAALAGER